MVELGDIWMGLARLEPVETSAGRIEIAYEVGAKIGSRTKFLPAWAVYLLPPPDEACALLVVSRSLTLTVFYPTRFRCSFAHEIALESLAAPDLADALHRYLGEGGDLDDLFACYRDFLASGALPL